MAINYAIKARENRVKALSSLKRHSQQPFIVAGYDIHPKETRRGVDPVFISTRTVPGFEHAVMH